MSPEQISNATDWINAALLAAVSGRPLDPGLSAKELSDIVVGREGIGPGTFSDASRRVSARDANHRFVAGPLVMMDISIVDRPVPNELRPREALNALGRAFDALENERGYGTSAELAMLEARCSGVPSEQVIHAVGFALASDLLRQVENGRFTRRRPWPAYDAGQETDDFIPRTVPRASALLSSVRDVFARRVGQHAPSDPPTLRFQRMLAKQGWTGFAGWWSATHTEMRALDEATHPSAICVLCGALLEGALVAIANPARNAGEWKQKFLGDPPGSWKFGALIDQAGAAGTFSAAEVAAAQMLSEVRNRIHAGRFAAGAAFDPPYTETHQARLARTHLETLLEAILRWPVVQAIA